MTRCDPRNSTEAIGSASRRDDHASGDPFHDPGSVEDLEASLANGCSLFCSSSRASLHFVRPEFYLKIMPPYLPWHRSSSLLSGADRDRPGHPALDPGRRRIAAWGLIALLIAVFPANIYAYMHQELIPAPPWLHLLQAASPRCAHPLGLRLYRSAGKGRPGR